MKYIIFALFLFIAQSALSQKLQVGPVISATVARPSINDLEIALNNYGKWAPGLGGGVMVNFLASKNFSLSSEFLFQHQRKTVRGYDGFTYFRESLNFLKAPILFNYSHAIGHTKLNIMVGPAINYWLSGKGEALVPELLESELDDGVQYQINFEGGLTDNNFVVSDPNRWQLGLQMGIGAIFPIQYNYLKVDARFEWGHTNMAKQHSTYAPFVFYDISLDHSFNTCSLTCAYLFSFDLFEITRKNKSVSDKKR